MHPEPVSQTKPRNPRTLNAYRHGLTGQVHILTPEDQVAYDRHLHDYQECFQPVGGVEAGIVKSIADGRWQIQRATAIEDSIFALDTGKLDHGRNHPEVDVALAKGRTWLANDKSLERLVLYASRIQRRVEKDIALLRQLQADRKAAFEKVVDDAEKLTQLAEEAGQSYDPASDFPRELRPPRFDFSDPQIVRLIVHHRRAKEARRLVPDPKKWFQAAA